MVFTNSRLRTPNATVLARALVDAPTHHRHRDHPCQREQRPSQRDHRDDVEDECSETQAAVAIRHRVRARRIRLPSGVTCCAGAKSPAHSSPSHQRISEGSPDGSGYQPGGMFMIAPVRLGPLRSGSCRSPVSRPRLAYSARNLHRPRITAPRHRRRDTGKPASIAQPRPRATHIMRHHRTACSVFLPAPPPPPECRLSRGFCTALRVFKRV